MSLNRTCSWARPDFISTIFSPLLKPLTTSYSSLTKTKKQANYVQQNQWIDFRDKDGKEYNIVLRLPFEDKIRLEDVDKIFVKSLKGKMNLILIEMIFHTENKISCPIFSGSNT